VRVGCGVCFGSSKIGDGGAWRVVRLDRAVVGRIVGTSQRMGRGTSNIYILDTAVDQRSRRSNALQCAVSPFVLRCAMGFWSPDSVAACPLLRSTLQLLLRSVSTGQGKSSIPFVLADLSLLFIVLLQLSLQVSRLFQRGSPLWAQVDPSKSSVWPVGGAIQVGGSSSRFRTLWEVCPSLFVRFSSLLTSVSISSPPNSSLGVRSP